MSTLISSLNKLTQPLKQAEEIIGERCLAGESLTRFQMGKSEQSRMQHLSSNGNQHFAKLRATD